MLIEVWLRCVNVFLFRIDKHWRLIGWGQIRRGIAVKPTDKQ